MTIYNLPPFKFHFCPHQTCQPFTLETAIKIAIKTAIKTAITTAIKTAIKTASKTARMIFLVLVLVTSTSCQNRIPQTCSTTSGNSCTFPFTYQGVEYYECTYASSATPWCATATDSQGEVVVNR